MLANSDQWHSLQSRLKSMVGGSIPRRLVQGRHACRCVLVSVLDQTPIYTYLIVVWFLALGSNNKHHRDTCFKEVGLLRLLHILRTTPQSVALLENIARKWTAAVFASRFFLAILICSRWTTAYFSFSFCNCNFKRFVTCNIYCRKGIFKNFIPVYYKPPNS